MSTQPVNIAVIDKDTVVEAEALRTTKQGKAIKVKAVADGKYMLAEGENGVAPENITVKRVGKDLWVSLEGTELNDPDLIIEDFFAYNGELVGKAENGEFYEYIASDARDDHQAVALIEGDESALVLGSEQISGLSNLLIAPNGLINPLLLGLGALAAIGAAIGVAYHNNKKHHDDNDNNDDSGKPGGKSGDERLSSSIESVTDDVGNVQGPLKNGDYTDDTMPTFSGSGAIPGDTIELWDKGVKIGETKIGDDGKWTLTPSVPLPEGDHSFTVIERDSEGNTGKPSDSFDLIIDTQAPGKATLESIIDDQGSITGPIAEGGMTDDSTPTLSGQAEANSKVIIYDKGVKIGEAMADSNGKWTFTPDQPLQDGEHIFTVVATDRAGNAGLPSDPHKIIIDTQAPENKGIGEVEDNVGLITGPVENGGATDDPRPTIGGGGTPGDIVTIIDKGEEIGSTVVGDDGEWTFRPEEPLPEGEHELVIVITDPAGNTSEPSDPYIVIVDTTPPEKPQIGEVEDNVGPITGPIENGGTTDDTTPTFGGSGEPGDVVTIIDNGDPIGSTVVGDNGEWTFTPKDPLPEGENNIVIVITDPAGNTSEPSDPYIVIVDTSAPIKPTIGEVIDDQGDKTGPVTAGDTIDDSIPTISGTAEAGSLVTVYDNGQPIGSIRAGADGSWTFEPSPPLQNGPHSLTVVAKDAAGNESVPSDAFDFTLAAGGAPSAPAIVGVLDDVGDVTGSLQKGDVTDDKRPTVSGTAEPGSTVTLYANGVAVGTTEADAQGNWTITADRDLNEGLNNLTAKAANAAGNLSPETGAYPIVVDTTAPGDIDMADTTLTDDVGLVTGEIESGDTTDDANPTFSGKAEPDATIIIRDKGVEIGTAIVDKDGNWTFTPDQPLSEGDHSLTLQPVDKAGNKGNETAPIDFVVDTSAVVISITEVIDDTGSVTGPVGRGQATDDTQPMIKGSATPDAIVRIYDNEREIGSTVAGKDGSWSFTPTVALTEGPHSLTATATTPAAGESAPTAAFDLIVDTTAPTNGGIEDVQDDVGLIQGPIENGGSTDDTTPTLSGKGNPGDLVTIIDNGQPIGSVKVGDNGEWSFTPLTPLPDMAHEFTTVITDPAGNVSAPSDPYIVIVDTTAPVKPAIGEVLDDQGDKTGPITAGDTIDDSIPTISGTAEAGSLVTVLDNGQPIGSTYADANGNWTFEPSPPLLNGPHSLTVVAKDAAGNESVPSDAFDFTLAAGGAPSAPAIVGVLDDVGDVTGSLQKGDVTDDKRPTVSGTAEPGSTVTLYANGAPVGTAQADAQGNWTITADRDLAEGPNDLTAKATNAAGNVSPETGAYPIVVDTTAPADIDMADTTLTDDVGLVTGEIESGDITDDANPTFTGKAEPDATIIIRDKGVEIGTAIVDKDGNWTFTPDQPLSEGEHSLTLQPVDKAGNKGNETAPIDFVVDTSAVVISITEVLDDVGSVTGSVGRGQATDDTQPMIKGSATPDAIVRIYDNEREIGSTVAGKDGSWSFTPTVALTEGPHSLTATATTPAAGESAPTVAFDLIVDTTAPTNGGIDTVLDDVGTVQDPVQNGGSTDDTTPTLVGKGTPGDLVTIIDNGQPIGSVRVGDNGEWSFTPLTPLPDMAHEFTTTITDPAGNVSAPSDPYIVIVDTTPPDNAGIGEVEDNVGLITGPVENGGSTDDTRPVIGGVGEPGTVVTIIDKGDPIGSATVGDDGQWTFQPEDPLDQGEHELVIVITDPAGNVSEPSDPYIVIVDTTAPVKPAIGEVLDDQGDKTGPITAGDTIDDSIPTISGTAEAGSLVTVLDNGQPIGSTYADANGNWTFEPSPPLLNGPHSLTVVAKDAAGNESVPSDAFDFTLAAGGAPSAPAIVGVLDDVGDVTGSLQKGDVTDDKRPTVSGTAEPGSTVTLYANGAPVGTAQADAQGNWTITADRDLAEGPNDLTAKATNAAGNVSPETGAYPIVVDTTAPADIDMADTTLTDDVGLVTGEIESGDITDDANPTFTGKAEPDATIIIRDKGVEIGTAIVDKDGNWTFTPDQPLSEGDHSLTLQPVDKAGNKGNETAPIDFVVDTSAVVISITEVLDDVGSVTGSVGRGQATDDTQPMIKGSATPDAIVRIYDGEREIGSTTAGKDGSWSFTPTVALTEGPHSLTATATTPAAGESAPTVAFDLIVDLTAPTNGGIDTVLDDVGTIQDPVQNGGSTDDTTPTLVGKGTPGDLVTVYANGQPIGSQTVGENGEWSFTPLTPLPDNTYEFTTTITDPAGNVSAASDPYIVIVDTKAPDNAGIGDVEDNVGLVTGPVENGGSTDDTRPVIGGVGEPGTVVTIIDKGDPIGSATVGDDGQWTFQPEDPLEQGEHELVIVITDPAGNVSEPSDPYIVIVDTTAPVKPAIGEVLDDQGDKTGPITAGGITDDSIPTISGTAEAGSLVTVLDNGQPIGSTYADADGNWTFEPSPPLLNGPHSLTVVAKDAAGNESVPSDAFDFTLAAGGAPSAPAIVGVLDDVGDVTGSLQKGDVTDDKRPTVSGTAEAGSTVTLYANGAPVGTAQADAQGNWTITADRDLAEGPNDLTAKATNAAGNVSPETGAYPIVVDTTAPGDIDMADTTLTDDVGLVTGEIESGDITDDANPTFTGKAEPDATIIIRDKGVEIGTAIVDKDGNWTFTPDQPLSEGDHSLTLQPVDKAGNKGNETAPIDFVVDTSAVVISITEVLDDVGSVTGSVGRGQATDDTQPMIKGNATPDAIVRIYDGEREIGSTTAGKDGSWSFTPTVALTEGPHSLTATATTPAAGESAPTVAFDLIVDLTAPTNGGIDTVLDDVGTIQDPVLSGGVTDDTTPTLVGKGTPGDLVTVYANGQPIGSQTVGENGEWSFTPLTPLPDNTYEFTTTITDPAGNVSAASDPYIVIVDTKAPDNAGIGDVEDNVGLVTGPVENGGSTDDTRPVIGGVGEPGTVVTIIDKGDPIGSATVGDDGQWTFQPEDPLEQGEHELVIVITDPAGNVSEPSDPYIVIVDTTAPVKPAIGEVLDDQGDKTGPITAGGITDDSVPTISGTAEAGSLVTVLDNGQPIGSTYADADGSWTFEPSPPLLNGPHSLTVVAKDAAGNESVPSDAFDFTLAIGPVPVAPVITGASDDVGDITGPLLKGDVTDDKRPTVSGTAEAGSTVTLYANGVPVGTALADAMGNWTITPDRDLTEGANNLTAKATNAAGNASPEAEAYPIVVDTTAPGAITDLHLIDDVGLDTGEITSGNTTDDAKPVYSGKAEPDATVIIRDNGVQIGTAIVGNDGNWTFTPDQPLSNGDHSFTAQPVDAAGNKGAETAPIDFVVDVVVPEVAITGANDDVGTITGALTSGKVTDDSRPELTGTGTANATIKIYDNNTYIGSTIVGANGQWSFIPSAALADNLHHLTATVTVAGGTESAQTAAFDLTIDTVADAPVINKATDNVGKETGDVNDGGITDDTTPTLKGTAEPGSKIYFEYREEGGSWKKVTAPVNVKANGSWSWTAPELEVGTSYQFRSKIVDEAGNTSPYSDRFSLYIGSDNTSGSENFASVALQTLIENNTITVPSGLKLTSLNAATTFIYQAHETYKLGHTLYLTNYSEIKLDFGGTNKISFDTYAWSGGTAAVKILDVKGNVIDTTTITGPVTGNVNPLPTHHEISAKFGGQIGSIVITLTDEAGIYVDNIGWGTNAKALGTNMSADDQNISGIDDHSSLFGLTHSEEQLQDDTWLTDAGGIHTLKMTGAEQTLTLSELTDKLESVDVVDIAGNGDNTLNISINDILVYGDAGLFIDDSKTQFMVKGDEGDVVNLEDLVEGSDVSDWRSAGEVTVGGTAYQVYQHSNLEAELLVQQGVEVNLV